MNEVAVDRNLDDLTMTFSTELGASVDDVWQLVADPRKLERWWGPPTLPAAVTEHDLTPGGRVQYRMTSPEGETFPGWWIVHEVDAPHLVLFEDGFADDTGEPDPQMPTTTTQITLVSVAEATTHVEIMSTFAAPEDVTRLLELGMEEGMTSAMAQMDQVLAD